MKDIKNHTTLTDNLVSWWHLGDGGGVRYDQHGSNNLTDHNSVGYEKGLHGNRASFDKDNSETLNIPFSNTGLFVAGQHVSIAGWFNLADVSVSNYIISLGSATPATQTCELRYDGGDDPKKIEIRYSLSNTNSPSSNFNVDLSADTDYFYCLKISSAGLVSILIKDTLGNTLLDSSEQKSGGIVLIPLENYNFSLAARNNSTNVNDNFQTMKQQSLGIWSGKLLSDDEIDDLYNYGVPLLYDSSLDFDTHTSLKSSLVFWNNLNSRLDVYSDSSDNNHDLVLLPAVGNTVHNTLPARKGPNLSLIHISEPTRPY